MQSGLILWSQLTSSSSSEGNKASHAVLNGPRTWLPAANDTEPWLQVDFSTNLQLVSLKTQGSPTSEQWVKSFTISYANSSGIFRNFTHGENFTVFRANTDATTIVETTLPEETKVRFLRINPKTWSKRPALRVEYYGCYTTCASAGPLSFLDSQITATSTYASSIYAHHARLNDKLGWISEHSKPASLLIDYGKRTTITGIKVQGNSEFAVWSSTFTVQYSNDGLRFKDYREAGSIKTFNGPVDASTVTERSFSHAIFTRFLKILAALSTNFYPTNPANTQYNFAALRIEVQGCHYDDDWFYSLPLGMKNNLILDSQINASSSRFYTSGAGNGRLNLTTIPNVRHGGWIAADGDKNPWFQVDFITNVTVSALLVQGLSGTAYGVTKYTIASSDDGKVFSVNKKEDQQTEKVFFATGEQSIFPHIIGRFIRIQPTGWNGLCAMRVEFFGRYEGCGNPEPLGMENGRILDRQLTAAQEHDSQPAPYGRLGHATGWNGGSMSNFDVWYQVDFIKHAKITAIKMQGEQASYHIKKFKVSFSNNGIDFIEYVDVMGLKIFTGQDVKETIVKHPLSAIIFSRFLRIHPVEDTGATAMRLELIGCYVDTILLKTTPLGMENGLILDSQLSASSERYYRSSGAASARFNAKTAVDGKYGGWIAAESDRNLWFEINFISNVTVTAILTQGLDIGMSYVKEYTVAFKINENRLQNYTGFGNEETMVFNAMKTTVKQDLDPYIFSSILQIKPKTCVGMCALRVELFGWYEEHSNLSILGMHNRCIRDDQIRSSVKTPDNHGAHAARMNDAYGWFGEKSGNYLEIDFGKRASITQIMTQGAKDSAGNRWTRNFTVAMSSDGVTFVDYQEFGSRKTFSANTDHSSIVVQKPMHVIFARFIRIIVDFAVPNPGLRLEFLGNFMEDNKNLTPSDTHSVALGMEDRLILDSQIFASSSRDFLISGAANARLSSSNISDNRSGGWVAAEEDSAPWLMVDFISNVKIKEIAIQGRKNESSYVTKYMLEYGTTRSSLQYYVGDNSSRQIFVEYNNRSIVWQPLHPAIFTRFVRIKVIAWVGVCAMRVEFYGYYEECPNPQPLGIENGYISDSQLDSSSIPTITSGPGSARLNLSPGGAELSDSDSDMWYEVNFLRWTKITGIKTQSAAGKFELIQTFTVSYSSDGNTFIDYKEYGQVKIFSGNSKVDSIVEQRFSRVILAQYLRINPILWNGKPVIRMEVMGAYVVTDWFDPVALGMENKMILDSQLVVSSQYSISVASNARLNLKTLRENIDENTTKIVRYGGWIAAEDDNEPWFQVDFIANATISAILTQGLDNGPMSSQITKYTVAYGYNMKDSLQNYSIDGQVKVFSANYKNVSLESNNVDPPITARLLRIMPKKWLGYCALRVEFYGQYEECTDPGPLGLENGNISDGQLLSSTEYDDLNGAHNARLNLVAVTSVRDGGASLKTDGPGWFQVDFLKWTKITALKTQGHADDDYFIQKFNLHFSTNGVDFAEYKKNGLVKKFGGNSDQNTVVEHRLTRVVLARFLRVVPTKWNGIPSIRMEIIGSYVDTEWFEPVSLGMQDGLILDSQMLSSSSKYVTSAVGNARLNLNTLSDASTGNIIRHGGWIAADDDRHPWLQVDFITNVTLTAIATQGLENGNSWLTGYTLSFGERRNQLQNFSIEGLIKVFSANSDGNSTVVKQLLFPYIATRFIRITPKTWVGNCTVRLEFYGRYEGCSDPQALGMESGAILDSQLSSSAESSKTDGPQNARLNLKFISGVRGGGLRLPKGTGSWVQVDFIKWAKVAEIRTQGDQSSAYYTKTFNLLQSNDGSRFLVFKEFGKKKVFQANYDSNTIVAQRLTRVIFTRFLRIVPTDGATYIVIRMELFGAYVDTDWFQPIALGMESRLIIDAQLAVSSFKDSISGPSMARLNVKATTLSISTTTTKVTAFNATMNITNNITTVNTSYIRHGGWMAATNDTNPWFQVDFRTNVTVTALLMQGLDSGMAWVTKYTLAFGYERGVLQEYVVDQRVKLFSANYDVSNTVRQDLYPYIIARFLRIIPKIWVGSCALRVEFYGRYEDDNNSTTLGMGSGRILDGQISASSVHSSSYLPGFGRLNYDSASSVTWAGWRPLADADQWFQVDFETFAKVTSIFTLGLRDADSWITKFLVSFSNDGTNFQDYLEFGKAKVFVGNNHNARLSKQRLLHLIFARYIRVKPTAWYTNVALRIEFNGSYLEYDCIDPIPLGLESNLIVNPQLSSSSEKSQTSRARNARLRLEPIDGERDGAWIASADDRYPWLRVDFKSNVTLRGITTQGRFDAAEWVTSYNVMHSIDGINYETYKEDGNVKVFSANYDSNTTVKHYIDPPIFARYVRLHPKQCSGACALRAEFHGCYTGCQNPVHLGLANKVIADTQFNSSSYYTGYEAFYARLNHATSGWMALSSDQSPWLEVNFMMGTKVQEILSQGLQSNSYWVHNYTVSFSSDGKTFQNYLENDKVKVFSGNWDSNTVVRHVLTRVIFSYRIRIHPKKWYTYVGLRLEFAGCNFGCMYPKPLGMEAEHIKDYQISGSSSWKFTTAPFFGRLHSRASWMPHDSDTSKFVTVDFLGKTMLAGIIMQGAFEEDNFVTSFKVALKTGDNPFNPYQQNSIEKIFSGNVDTNTTVEHMFPLVFVTDAIRIFPVTWNGTRPAMRLELLGCYEDIDICDSSPCKNNGTCNDYFTTYNFFNCTCLDGYTGKLCEIECTDVRPLGMSGGQIKDTQLTASTMYDSEAVPLAARLHSVAIRKSGGWVAGVNDGNQWFQVDFLVNATVASILTQGRDNYSHWVETYQVSYSNDGNSFQDYTQGGVIKEFTGNSDRDTVVKNTLTPRLFTRFIRIHPKLCFMNCSLRVEFLGCYQVTPLRCLNPIPLGMENKQIKDNQITASSECDDAKFVGRCAAANGRANATIFSHHGAWIAMAQDLDMWFEVDFVYNTTVREIMTQGREDRDQWVKLYNVTYKNETGLSRMYDMGDGIRSKLFKGNFDRNTVINHTLSPVIHLQIIRIHPLLCHGACALRIEFVGCYEDADVCDPSPCRNNATCNDQFDFFNSFNCTCPAGYTGKLCETDIDECLSYPCLNNGACNDFVNIFNCTCTIDFWGNICEFEVIWPIANFSVTPIPAHRFGGNISVVWEMDQGSYVTVEVYYNENICCNRSATNHLGGNTSQCNCLVTDPARFDPDGLVDFRIYAYNSVSNETVNLSVEVLKIIKNVRISTKTSIATWGIGVDGTGSQRNVFPTEHPVKMSATFDGGPASIIKWTFSCSVSPTISDESKLSFDKTFPNDTSQTCVINLSLTNNISTDHDDKTIDLKESLIFTSLTYDGPLKPNQTMTFTISFKKFGQGTCVVMDLGDNSSLLVFGDASCKNKFDVSKINPKIVEDPPLRFSSKDPTTSTITITHEYPGVGTYDVKMSAANLLANVTESLIAVVIPFVCKYPNVTIIGLPLNTSNLLQAPQVFRSKLIFLSTENEIYCEPTNLVKVSWTVYRILDDPVILNTNPLIRKSDLGKTVYLADIISPDLSIPERGLPFGYYEISGRVEMQDIPYVFGIGTLYVQIIQTPWIIAGATTGSFYTVPFQERGFLNASASVDPDFNNTDAMSFAWYCRDVGGPEFQLSDVANLSLVTAPAAYPVDDLGGCFGTGPGQLNSTDKIVEFDTGTMVEDKYYIISLVASTSHQGFAVRRHLTNIYFHVARGKPPGLVGSCFKNCLAKTNRDEKLIIKAKCNARCYGELAFTWSLYRYDDINTPEPFNLSSLHEFTSSQLKEMTTSPIDALEIALKPKSLDPGKKYILAFIASRPSGVFGELRFTLITNEAPVNGTCSISPLYGVAMETNFTVTCKHWEDEDVPITVEFSHIMKSAKTVFYFQKVPNRGKVTETLSLSAGDEASDYYLNISITVKDRFFAQTKDNMTIQVVPQPKERLDLNQLKNLVSGEGNALAELFQTGDSVLAVNLASNVASTLNNIKENTTSNDSSSTQEKDTSKQIRTQVILSLASANLSAEDASSLEQVSAAVLALTKNTEELEPQSQGAVLQMTETLTSNLRGLSDSDQGFSNVLRGASNLVGGIGQMTTSMTKEAGNSSNGTEAADKIKRSIGMIDNIQGVLLDNLVGNEPPVKIEFDALSVQVEKVMTKSFANKTNVVKGAKFETPSPVALGIQAVVGNRNKTIFQMQPVDIKIAVSDKNPFIWDNTSKAVSSNVVDIKVQSSMNISTSNVSEDFAITIPRDPKLFSEQSTFFLKPSHENATTKAKEYLRYHRFERTSVFTSITFDMRPVDQGLPFSVYLKKGSKPDIAEKDYQFSFDLPDLSSCFSGNESASNSSNNDELESDGNTTIPVYLKKCTRDPYAIFVSNVDLNGTGQFWFAVQHIRTREEDDKDESRRRRSIPCGGEGRRVRRSCVVIPTPPPEPTDPPTGVRFQKPENLGFDGKYFFPNQTPNYNLTMYESSCLYWDENNETWTGDGCKVVLGTSREKTMCKCNHLTSFGSEFLVAPNTIEFDSVFSNFSSLANNVAVLALISTILGIYIIGVVWGRRADKKDALMVGPTILPEPRGSYHYLITTYTGSRPNSGTTAKVVFKMSGDLGETIPARLYDCHRPCFERQQENMFVVSYPQGIGDLSFVQIWHDNSESSPSWYLSRMIVRDLQTEKTWSFLCENWLAVESEDGKVCRVLPVANEKEMTNFGHLFSVRAVKGLSDGHIWLSIFTRPPTSKFTRVQRLSCALSLLCSTMITSAMFYDTGGRGSSPYSIHIGTQVINLQPFVIGLQSSVIIIPINILLVSIFRNICSKKKKNNSDEDDTENPNGVKIEDSIQEPSKGKLPHWCIYIAYAICFVVSTASIFFTILYSIQWGKETSTEWVIAMVTSFISSVLLLQPFKAVLLSLVLATFIRKPAHTKSESYTVTLAEDNTFEERTEIQSPVSEDMMPNEEKSKKYLRPPGSARLKRARTKRVKELKMNSALKEIIVFFLFLICLLDVAQYHRDPNTYLLTKTLSQTFVDVDSFSIPFSWIVDGDAFWMWARETLIPGLYSTEWYNGKIIEKGYLANIENYLVGVPRLRLLRVKEGSCKVSSYFKDTIPVCNSAYSVINEDEEEYEPSWEPLHDFSNRKRRRTPGPESEEDWLKMVEGKEELENEEGVNRRKRAIDPIQSGRNRRRKNRLLSSERPKTYVVQTNALMEDEQILSCLERWHYQSMLELRGFPYWGEIAVYGGSGYAANLGYDQMTAYTVVADLHSNNWITRQTRAVFVEFTVYNANTNLFSVISLFIEFPSSSGVVTKVQIQSARFYLHLNVGQIFAHILVIFFMLYFLYREGKLFYKQRWAYFKGFWNWVETILIISEFALVLIFLARLYEVDRNLLQLRENPNDYVGFQFASQADAAMSSIFGILVFLYILRFLRLLRFNRNFLSLGATFSRITKPILNYLIPFTFGFTAFGMLAFSVFGAELEDYSTFVRTMVTQFSMSLGDFDFEALTSVSPVLGAFYFFAFVAFFVVVLMNIFIAIINDSLAEVKIETCERENEYDLVNYVVAKVVEIMKRKNPNDRQRKDVEESAPRQPEEVKLIGTNTITDEIDLKCEKFDKLLDDIEQGFKEDIRIEVQICSVVDKIYF